ncbi:MAG: T9SS type A sorting domain-containing protein [Bacteroidales bacterium]|nr:T9SS type A sorting domain-containing protein [Bacteroidales bacterium]MCF8403764.1 T9SS type A sorting domain-containing protein [Bacteroidales bacterium]
MFAINHGDYLTTNYATKILLLNTFTGKFMDSVLLNPYEPEFTFGGIADFLKVNDSLFIGIGNFIGNNENAEKQYILHINSNLNVVFDTIVDTDMNEKIQKSIVTENGLIVSVGKEFDTWKIVLLERDYFGNFIRFEKYNHPTSLTATTVIDIPHKNKYHMFMYLGSDHPYDLIDKFSLEIDTTLSYPIHFHPIDAVIDPFDTSVYYIAGKQGSNNPNINNLSFLRCNTDGNFVQHIYLSDSNESYSYKCMSVLQETMYFGGTVPFTQSPPTLYPEQRWILIYKLLKNGEVMWQKYYKGEVNYMPIKVLATPDGGAIIFSTRYDWNDPIPNQRDVHILKIDSAGYYTPLTGTKEEFEQMEKQILVYPNPVDDEVNFVFGLYNNLTITIFDLSGKQVFSKDFKHSPVIDLSFLKPGIYPYTISGKKGFFEEGKLIKK